MAKFNWLKFFTGAWDENQTSAIKEWWNSKVKPWWKDKVSDNFDMDTRDNNEGVGRFLNGIDNFWNRITGSGLTNAEREANKYSAAQAEAQYNREVEFYEKYQSPKAMMQQGINPFGVSGSTGGHTASGGSPSSVAPQGAEGLTGIMNLVSSIFGMTQEKRRTDSQVQLNSAQAALLGKQATAQENQNNVFGVLHNLNVEQLQTAIAKDKQAIAESIQRVKESMQNITESNSRIEVNGSVIQLNGSTSELNAAKTVVEKLTADKMSILMPYLKAREEAAIAYTNAKTQESIRNAEKLMYDANISMLKGMVEADLIDKGYYDNLIQQSEFETITTEWKSKTAKRDYKWKPANDICSNVSKLCVGAASVIGAVKGIGVTPPVAGAPSYQNDPALSAPMIW